MTNTMQQEAEMNDEYGCFGDPRRCLIHGIATSSPDGMFDTACGACESEMDAAAAQRDWEALSPEAREEELAWLAKFDAERLARGTWVPEADDVLF